MTFSILLPWSWHEASSSAQKFLLEDKDPLSGVCLDSWEYVQEYPLLLQALWHTLAESCILLFYFHSYHEAFHKTAVELPGLVTSRALFLPGPTHQQKHCFLHVCLSERLTLLLQAGEICKSIQLLHSFSRHCAPLSLLFKQHEVNNCGQICV